MASLVRPGITTADIDRAIEGFFAQHGAVPLFKGVPGKVPFPAVCCTSVNDEVVHGIPGARVLVAGDVVSVDTGCSVDGWCGDSAVTYAVGPIAPEAQRLLDCTAGVLALAIERDQARQRSIVLERDQYSQSSAIDCQPINLQIAINYSLAVDEIVLRTV